MIPLLLAVSVWAMPAYEDGFSIDRYLFQWSVAKSGNAELSIVKDENSTRLMLSVGFDSIAFDANETDSLCETFRKSDGSLELVNDSGLVRIVLKFNPQQVKAITPHLQKSRAMIDFVNRKIRPD